MSLVVLALSSGACASMLATPQIEDAPAPREYFAQASGPEPTCTPQVELLRAESQAVRPYREVSTLSATCYPGTPEMCERRLVQRACELKADAVILMEPERGGTPAGASSQSQIAMSGRAVRWKDQ